MADARGGVYDGAMARSWWPRRRPAPAASSVPVDSPPAEPPPTFVDPELEAQFRDVGYVVVDLLDPDQVARLNATCEHHHPEAVTTWDSDFFSTSLEAKAEIAGAIQAEIEPKTDHVLTGHQAIMTNFAINWPGPDGGLVLHHHSSIVDERTHRSVVVWCAINDATEENGTLHVVERSHLVPRGAWGGGRPNWFADRHDRLIEDHLTSIPVRAGQALMFDNALLHCSFPNVAREPRRTALAIMAPRGVPLRYYKWVPGGTTRAYALEPDFFLRTISPWGGWAEPDEADLLGEESDEGTLPSEQEIDALLRPGSCPHPVEAAAWTSHP